MTHFIIWWDAVGCRRWGEVIDWPERFDPTPENFTDFVKKHPDLRHSTYAHLIHIETGHVRAMYTKGKGSKPGKHPWVCLNASRFDRAEVL